MKKLAVIVPCYNEEAVIEESYRRTKEVLVKLPNPTEIIYINDGSQDKTRSLLDHIAATDPLVKVIHFSRNFGHQPAVTAVSITVTLIWRLSSTPICRIRRN